MWKPLPTDRRRPKPVWIPLCDQFSTTYSPGCHFKIQLQQVPAVLIAKNSPTGFAVNTWSPYRFTARYLTAEGREQCGSFLTTGVLCAVRDTLRQSHLRRLSHQATQPPIHTHRTEPKVSGYPINQCGLTAPPTSLPIQICIIQRFKGVLQTVPHAHAPPTHCLERYVLGGCVSPRALHYKNSQQRSDTRATPKK